jgi:hypothetical protein
MAHVRELTNQNHQSLHERFLQECLLRQEIYYNFLNLDE